MKKKHLILFSAITILFPTTVLLSCEKEISSKTKIDENKLNNNDENNKSEVKLINDDVYLNNKSFNNDSMSTKTKVELNNQQKTLENEEKVVYTREKMKEFANKYIRSGEGNKYVKLGTQYELYDQDLLDKYVKNDKSDFKGIMGNKSFSLYSTKRTRINDSEDKEVTLNTNYPLDTDDNFVNHEEMPKNFKIFTLDLSSTNLTEIPPYAFSTWESRTITITELGKKTTYFLGNVILPNTLKTIKHHAFYLDENNFDNQEKFKIIRNIPFQISWDNLWTQNFNSEMSYNKFNGGLINIEESAFENNFIPWLMLPKSIQTIGDKAFKNVRMRGIVWLNWIENGNPFEDNWNTLQLRKIGKYAFANNWFNWFLDRFYYSKNYITNVKKTENLSNFSLESKYLEQISEGAFSDSSIYSVSFFDDSSEKPLISTKLLIDKDAFKNNKISKLTFSKFLNNLTIGEDSFLGNSINDIKLPVSKNLKLVIKSGAFKTGKRESFIKSVKTYEDYRIKIVNIYNSSSKTLELPKWLRNNAKISNSAF